MNKQKINIILVIIVVLIMSGCKNTVSNEIVNIDGTITMEADTTKILETTSEEKITTDNTTTGQTAYTVVTEKIMETQDCITRSLEYPQFFGESDRYDCINETIKNTVISINSPMFEITDDDELYYTGIYEIICHTEDIVSIEFKSTFWGVGMAYPVARRYGLTIDLNTLTPITLDNYFDSVEDILTLIDTDDYNVIEGGMMIYNKEEIKSEIISSLNNDEINTYINNFYVSDDSIYIIENGMLHALGDFSIIEFPMIETKSDEAEPVTGEAYTIVAEKINETEDYITRNFEYPRLSGEDKSYDDINALIKDMVNTFNSPKEIFTDNKQRYYNGIFEIVYQSEELISMDFYCCTYVEGEA